MLEEDRTSWQSWWGFNRAPYLDLRVSVHSGEALSEEEAFFTGAGFLSETTETLAPSRAVVRDEIVPALVELLEQTDDRDVTSSCLIALAKIGVEPPNASLNELFERRLQERDQEIRETAALALGISQQVSAVPTLIALVRDGARGRELSGGRVHFRTRAFAATGLGLIVDANAGHEVQQQAGELLLKILQDRNQVDRNLPVAAILSLGMLRPADDLDGRSLRDRAVAGLLAYYRSDLGKGMQVVQAHVPTSIANLFERANRKEPGTRKTLDECRRLFLRDLSGRGPRDQHDIGRSCALALAQMSRRIEVPKPPVDCDPHRMLDFEVSRALIRAEREARDHQTRFFATIGLGTQGGRHHRDVLLRLLRQKNSTVAKPWPAIALGVLAHRAVAEGRDCGIGLIGERLVAEVDTRSPEVLGSLAIALGLCEDRRAGEQLIDLMEDQRFNDRLAGNVAIGLALMGEDSAIPALRELLEASVRREERLRQSAIALGRLGDKHAQSILLAMLTDDESPGVARMAALSSALVMIGDRDSVRPLIRTMQNEDMTPLARAFAASALGGIADDASMPWNAEISVGLNYRAVVETLTDGTSGLLDIL